jgi:hypothetical protein
MLNNEKALTIFLAWSKENCQSYKITKATLESLLPVLNFELIIDYRQLLVFLSSFSHVQLSLHLAKFYKQFFECQLKKH